MIDYYWLKSFTEIMQLFLTVLFIIYFKVKFDRSTSVVFWLSLFFYIKLATDLYGILNYTSWISSILTRPVLEIYRSAMGSFELGMITSLLFFVRSTLDKVIKTRQAYLYFIPAVLLFPLNWLLIQNFESSLLVMFNIMKTIWVVALIYMIRSSRSKPIVTLLSFMLFWNVLWLIEVVLHEQLNFIGEATSWVIFVIAELMLTVGLFYFLVQIIAHPRILRFENPQSILPGSLLKSIEMKLGNALDKEKIYKDPDLSAVSLANHINISAGDLTIYLNRVLNKNFNQSINDYRIEESKRLLKHPDASKMSIEQVMYACGFNSKSVFNTAFKQRTGVTPNQYKRNSF